MPVVPDQVLEAARKWLPAVGVLMMGTVMAQAISLLGAPVMTRLYGPAAFGVFAVFAAFVNMVSSISGGRLELAVSIPRRETAARSIAEAARVLTFVVSGVAFLAISLALMLSRFISTVPEIPVWVLAFPLAVVTIAWNGAYAQENLRALKFGLQARLRVLQSALYAGAAIGIGVVVSSPAGLVAATCIAQLAVLYSHIRRNPRILGSLVPTLAVIRRYRGFPLKQVPATLIETGTAYIPIIFIAPQFGASIAGYFFLAQTVLRQPVQFVSTAIGEVLRQWMSRKYAAGENPMGGVRVVFLVLLALSVTIFLPFALLAPILVPVAFGPDWEGATVYFQLFAALSGAQFVVSPLSSLFFVRQRQGLDLVLQIGTGAGVLAGLVAAGALGMSPVETVFIYVLVYVLRYIIQAILSFMVAAAPT